MLFLCWKNITTYIADDFKENAKNEKHSQSEIFQTEQSQFFIEHQLIWFQHSRLSFNFYLWQVILDQKFTINDRDGNLAAAFFGLVIFIGCSVYWSWKEIKMYLILKRKFDWKKSCVLPASGIIKNDLHPSVRITHPAFSFNFFSSRTQGHSKLMFSFYTFNEFH